MDACPACVDFAVITFLSFIHFSLWENMSTCFLQLSAQNIHLLSRYPAAGEGFDNNYIQHCKLSYMLRVWLIGSCDAWLKGINLLKLDSVANHCPKCYYCRFTLN